MINLTPYALADSIFYRLGKKLEKQELGLTLKFCKELIASFREKGMEDYEVVLFIETLCYEMRKKEMPLVFRMFYSITVSFLTSNAYCKISEPTPEKYRDWITMEIDRLKNS